MKYKITMLLAVLAIAVVSCMAADIDWHPRKVTFADALTIGGTPLPPGEYKVEHVMRGEEHIMVFTNVDQKKLHAEAKCHMVSSPQKEARAVQGYETVNGQNRLKTLIFKGDVFVHELY